jgi:CheY-like chemotaxis protein
MIMKRILLVDDDAFLRDMYATKFTQSGYDVDVAESPATALRKVESEPTFDIILLDMIMPGMTGTELIANIKEKFPELKSKCIVLSNQGQDEDIKEANEAGAIGYIVKAEMVPSAVVKRVAELAAKK